MVKTKMCPKCNYDFTQDSDPKHVWTVFFLIVAVIAVITADVYTFQNHMKEYNKNNPYENVESITTEDKNTQTQDTSSTQTQTDTTSK